MLLTIFVFVAVLGTLVLVHELGHFIVAKRNGIFSDEFGFGFPPRIIGTYKDKTGKRKWIFGSKEIPEDLQERGETVYSLNLIPIGGFVKLRGEDGESKEDPKSFSAQNVWVRFKVLFAGVGMNFVLAVFLFYFAFLLGLPETIDDNVVDPAGVVQIASLVDGAPAKEAGFQLGDKVISIVESDGNETKIGTVTALQETVSRSRGSEIQVSVLHPGEENATAISLIPRSEFPENEGALGVQIVRTTFVRHGPIESFWIAIKTTASVVGAIFAFLGDLIMKLFRAESVPAEVAGPVGIAVLTGQVTRMGFAFVLQFAALLSVNLAIINLLPFPALDGGRILFLMIEKVKGSPVSEKIEGLTHTVGFFILISLMILVTVRDFANFEIVDKVKGLF